MSTAALPGPYSPESFSSEEFGVPARITLERVERSRSVRRRGSAEQGRALERLGHAVEYLVDSGMFLRDERNQRDEDAAIQILMRLSRAVFAGCPEVVPVRKRLGNWARGVAMRAAGRG